MATHAGLEALKVAIWRRLQLVRVYSKPPGKPADKSAPFVLPHGHTVSDFAERVHREIAEKLQFARVWGGKLEGQRVARDFELRDRESAIAYAKKKNVPIQQSIKKIYSRDRNLWHISHEGAELEDPPMSLSTACG